MREPNARAYLVSEWLKHAADDELNVKAILKDRDGTPAQICFLSQQMGEKYLKALILYATGDYPKTHDLSQLVVRAKRNIPTAEELKTETILLDPYYVGTRYPADIAIEELTWQDADDAFAAALRIKEFVLRIVHS
ncbi:MAG: HEPN domain-containing protein [Parcubacteria group bacterium Gr01-1014_33]|nr:MAG: HEPN domain-containing protein [Parcubacteria group bacterium Gr01-1014_33]